MMTSISHRVGAVAFFSLLLLPMSQMVFEWAPIGKLKGVEAPRDEGPEFSWETWWSGDWAQSFASDWTARLGLRDIFVRTENQINWAVFRSLTGSVFAGPDNDLFQRDYLPGKDWCDAGMARTLEGTLAGLKAAQDVMEKVGIELLPVISPSKVRFLADRLPAGARAAVALERPTQLTQWRRLAKSLGLRYMDGPAFFTELETRTRAPIFTQGGTHWSNYAAGEVAVRILRDLDERYPVDYLDLEITGVKPLVKPMVPDDDLAQLTNLWSTAEFFGSTAKPIFRWKPDSGVRKPRILAIGTSFLWPLLHRNRLSSVLEDIEVFYYNRTHFRLPRGRLKRIGPIPDQSDPSFLTKLSEFDLVILEAPETALLARHLNQISKILAAAIRGK